MREDERYCDKCGKERTKRAMHTDEYGIKHIIPACVDCGVDNKYVG